MNTTNTEKKLKTKQKMEQMGVTVIHSKPEIFERCEKEFGISWDYTIFACDPYIHSKEDLTDDIIEHELVHIQQQREHGGVDKWWDTYFSDKAKRLEWELEAYNHQYHFLLKRNTLNKAQMFAFVLGCANNLAGKPYGELISIEKAVKEITK